MSKFVAKVNNYFIIFYSLMIAIGVALIISRARFLHVILMVIGALMVAYGIVHMLRNKLTLGMFLFFFGLIIALGGMFFLDVIVILIGIGILGKGCLEMIIAMKTKSSTMIIDATVSCVIGILLMVRTGQSIDIILIITGCLFVALGIFGIIKKNNFMNYFKHDKSYIDVDFK